MFCAKCGNELKDGAKFCTKCGCAVELVASVDNDKTEILDMANEVSSPKAQKSKKEATNYNSANNFNSAISVQRENEQKKSKAGGKIAIIIALILVIVALVAACIFLFFSSEEEKVEQSVFGGRLKEAQEMLDEDNYEEAIGYYKEILEDDSESEEAYVGLAEAYLAQNQVEEAIKVLETGYEVIGSEELKELLDEVREENDLEDAEATDSGEGSVEQSEPEVYTGEKTDINIEVRQVDNSNFPEVTLYASITDMSGNTVEELKRTDFNITEIDGKGNVTEASVDDVYQVLNEDKINVNLVLDASGSMASYNKMQQAKNAANAFVDQIEMGNGDQVEVISFDSFVYLEQEFSSQSDIVKAAINNIDTNGQTALYDALYAGLFQTYYEEGAKCVIGFTDGAENSSSYTFEDVVNMAQNTGIPVFIIGIGDEYDVQTLQNLASQCSGKYYSANVNDLETILEDIYVSIYREQQDYYVFKYTTTNDQDLTQFRNVVLETSDTTEFRGSYTKAYVPQADISGAFSDSYMNLNYILDFSGQRAITESDLAGLSLAELRIARNEIFARHGRQFRDSMLNQWFYSKAWYLNLPAKFSPDDFDAISPSPLSKLESDNANFIKAYENAIMSTQDIFPNAGNVLLSDYDLALSKAVLRTALNQMQTYTSTTILEENKRLVQEAINKEDVQY